MGKLKQETMIDATEERKNRMNGESCLLTPHEAKIHDDIFLNELQATIEDKEIEPLKPDSFRILLASISCSLFE